ncbi:hypothetical protein KY285_000214 [Solanum tuberosum]|nr:hypothetical protein KY284_000238 [Solanum tuberosum]KAH0764343.1 hypothetical protein KY285_000214 [Solanum tuberosum]
MQISQVDQALWKKVVNAKHGTKNHWSTKVVSSPYDVGPWKYTSKLGPPANLQPSLKIELTIPETLNSEGTSKTGNYKTFSAYWRG